MRCASRCAPASWRPCARAGARWWCACAPAREVPAGMVFAPIHWNRAFASDARVGALTNPVVDPISGEPELKHTPVAIEHFAADWYGVLLARSRCRRRDAAWWTRVHRRGIPALRTRRQRSMPDWSAEARQMLGVPVEGGPNRLDRIPRSGAARLSRARGSSTNGSQAASTSTPAVTARARLAGILVCRAETGCGRARQPARRAGCRRFRPGGAGVFLLRRGTQCRLPRAPGSWAPRPRRPRSASA